MGTADIARFDAQLPREQKEFLKRAAIIGGFRNLTDFILFAAQEKANAIVEKKQRVIISEKDKEVFFEAILNPQKPNDKLKKAASRYKDVVNL